MVYQHHLDLYIYEFSEECLEFEREGKESLRISNNVSSERVEEIENKNKLFAEKWGVPFDEAICLRFISNRWHTEPQVDKEWVTELLEKKCPNDLHESLRSIGLFLLAWSKGIIIDDALDKLAKYVISSQVLGNDMFSLNLGQLDKLAKKKPAYRPITIGTEIYIETLMAYIETGSISETARKIGKSNKTIRDYLKIIVGEDYVKIKDGTHPRGDAISQAHKLWLSTQK